MALFFWVTAVSAFSFYFLGVDILVEPLRATLQTKVKANSVKQEFEKQDELKRSALRGVAALLSIPDSGKFHFVNVSLWCRVTKAECCVMRSELSL